MQWQKVFASAKTSFARLASRISEVRDTHAYAELDRSVREVARRGHVSVGLLATSVAGVTAAGIIGPAGDGEPASPETTMAAQEDSVVRTESAPESESAESESAEEDSADQIDQWISEATDIMEDAGYAVSDDDSDEIRTVIVHESGGDPNAINLWDSNAVKGIPSKGLMQTIDPTFDAYKMPGHEDIYDPVDNIIAGWRYTLDRYGSLDNHPGLKSMANGGDYRGY